MMTSSYGNISSLLALCAGNSLVTGEFPSQRPVTRSFDVFFDLRLNTRLSKQSWCWWFETPSRPLWRHCNISRPGWALRLAADRTKQFPLTYRGPNKVVAFMQTAFENWSLLNWIYDVLTKISLKFVPESPIDHTSLLEQLMNWRPIGTTPLPEQPKLTKTCVAIWRH